jgi:hypothetical protein
MVKIHKQFILCAEVPGNTDAELIPYLRRNWRPIEEIKPGPVVEYTLPEEYTKPDMFW